MQIILPDITSLERMTLSITHENLLMHRMVQLVVILMMMTELFLRYISAFVAKMLIQNTLKNILGQQLGIVISTCLEIAEQDTIELA